MQKIKGAHRELAKSGLEEQSLHFPPEKRRLVWAVTHSPFNKPEVLLQRDLRIEHVGFRKDTPAAGFENAANLAQGLARVDVVQDRTTIHGVETIVRQFQLHCVLKLKNNIRR